MSSFVSSGSPGSWNILAAGGKRLPCSWTNSSAEIDRNWMNIRTSDFSRIDDVRHVFFACWICISI